MRLANVRTIFLRELRDQLRDRRTLFMIFVLPVLLYPILGLGMTQVMSAFDSEARRVVIVGANRLPADAPPLLNADRTAFEPRLARGAGAEQIAVQAEPEKPPWSDPAGRDQALRQGQADAIVLLPADIGKLLADQAAARIPIVFDSTSESSQLTYLRTREVLARWQDSIVARRLERDNKTTAYTRPVEAQGLDVAAARDSGGRGTVWAKLFPFLLVMMSLTGAFYPAVDICAGEKERGTMETLLISPASRGEIVLGKFLTVWFASMATAILNLVSMGLTLAQVGSALAGVERTSALTGARSPAASIEPPSLDSLLWVLLFLVPLSIFFSAICLALAVLARSMKEGQYYMTPLYLVALPLIVLTLMPGVELNAFSSLLPITGMSLLLKDLMLGRYGEALPFLLPVLLTNVVYAVMALRWAVGQFYNETVLFREAERFSIADWLRHLVRDRGPQPGSGSATLAFALIVVLSFFTMNIQTRLHPMAAIAANQILIVLGVPLVMALVLTSRPGLTLRLRAPRLRDLALALGLVLALNPLVNELRGVVEHLFPVSDSVARALESMVGKIPNLALALILLALIPGLCEEIAFRGYILSGLESGHSRGSAILISACLFGFLHVLISLAQQFFNATLLGLVLGLLAVQTRSLWPGVLFHVVNNGLAVLVGSLVATEAGRRSLSWLYRDPARALYHGPWVAVGSLFSICLLFILLRWDAPADVEPTHSSPPGPEPRPTTAGLGAAEPAA